MTAHLGHCNRTKRPLHNPQHLPQQPQRPSVTVTNALRTGTQHQTPPLSVSIIAQQTDLKGIWRVGVSRGTLGRSGGRRRGGRGGVSGRSRSPFLAGDSDQHVGPLTGTHPAPCQTSHYRPPGQTQSGGAGRYGAMHGRQQVPAEGWTRMGRAAPSGALKRADS